MRRLLILVGAAVLAVGLPSAGADTGLPPFISVSVSGSGTVNDDHGNSCSSSCTFGYGNAAGAPPPPNVTFAAAPAAGWSFKGWGGECSGTGACTVGTSDPAQSHAISASFAPSRFRLEVSVSGNGRVTSSPVGIDCGATCSATFDSGTQVTLNVSAGPDATFDGWGGDCASTSPSNTCVLTMNRDHSASASFGVQRFRLLVSVDGNGRVTSNPAGIDCGSTCGATFDSGTRVTLTASPAAGATFSGWGGDCASASTSTTCVLTIGANRSASAAFGALPPAAAFTAPPSAESRAYTELRFDASGSTSPGAPIVRYAWDLDGSGHYQATCGAGEPLLVHSFPHAGRHDVGLQITDALGRTATFHQTVNVSGKGGALAGATAAYACGSFLKPPGCIDEVHFDFDVVRALDNGCFAELKVTHEKARARGLAGVSPPNLGHVPLDVGLDLLRANGKVWGTQARVEVNGLEITPLVPSAGNAPLVIADERAGYLWSARANVDIAGSESAQGAKSGIVLARNYHLSWWQKPNAQMSVPLTTLPNIDRYLPKLFGLRLVGDAAVTLGDGKADVDVNVELPDFLGTNSDGALTLVPTGRLTLVADFEHGLHVDRFHLDLGQALLEGLPLDDLHVDYTGKTDVWEIGAEIDLEKIKVAGHVVIAGGDFQEGDGKLDFVDPGIGPVTPPLPVYLNQLDFKIDLGPPLVLVGGIEFSAGGRYSIPRVGDADLVHYRGEMTFTGGDPWVLSANGNEFILGFQVAQGHILYRSTGEFDFGGGLDVNLFSVWRLVVTVGGFVNGNGSFNIQGHGSLELIGDFKEGADVIISSRGFAACAELGWVHAGFGYRWGHTSPDLIAGLGDCDLGDWRVSRLRVFARREEVASDVALPAGLPFAAFEIRGDGAAPHVDVTGPNGETARSVPGAPQINDRFVTIEASALQATYVFVKNPAAGTWRIESASGSAPVLGVREADGLPQPSVSAHVTGAGHRRVLHYRIRPVAGQTVTFSERGPQIARTIGEAALSTGSFPFAPGYGPAGLRTILARVDEHGVPRRMLTVATYVAPAPRRAARPLGVRAGRLGSTLVVRVGSVPGASHYVLTVRISDGRRLLFVESRSVHVVRAARLAASSRATVTVYGVDAANRYGPAATVLVARTRVGR